MSTISRHQAGVVTAGEAQGGRFKARERTNPSSDAFTADDGMKRVAVVSSYTPDSSGGFVWVPESSAHELLETYRADQPYYEQVRVAWVKVPAELDGEAVTYFIDAELLDMIEVGESSDLIEQVEDPENALALTLASQIPDEADRERCIGQYLESALFSSTDEDGEPLDGRFCTDNFASETRERMETDLTEFISGNRELVDRYLNAYEYGQLAHDFWLTRNGHGAGFWDRGIGELGSELTEAAKVHGSVDLYVGDDGQIYAM